MFSAAVERNLKFISSCLKLVSSGLAFCFQKSVGKSTVNDKSLYYVNSFNFLKHHNNTSYYKNEKNNENYGNG